jgi:hypothetical protein
MTDRHVVTYTTGWTRFGCPCSVRLVDGRFDVATFSGRPCDCVKYEKPEPVENNSDDDK